jgi:hypothetical protein
MLRRLLVAVRLRRLCASRGRLASASSYSGGAVGMKVGSTFLWLTLPNGVVKFRAPTRILLESVVGASRQMRRRARAIR